MGVLFGLLAAILWGTGDYLINRLTIRLGTTRALVVTQVFSLLAWVAVGVALGFPGPNKGGFLGTAVVCGVFHVVGLALTYRAFEIGTLSIVSPIASSFAIVTAVLSLASGERPSGPALTGAFLLVAGVAVVTRASSDGSKASLKGVPEALGSALGFGVMFWLIERVTEDVGMAGPLIVLKVMATVSAIGAALWKKREPSGERLGPPTLLLGLAVALSDTLAWVAWIYGTKTDFNTVVTALASLFSVVTVVLAALLLKERLNRWQLAGITVVFLGILLVSV